MAPIAVDEEERRKANLRVLQRIDNSILDITGSATHVVLYEFNEAAQAWEKKDVEGSLFVAKRSDSPRFKMIVLNRSSKENLDVPLTSRFQMQVREPYLIFREDKGKNANKIRGIWFHDGNEREDIAFLLKKIVKILVDTAKLEQKNAQKMDPDPQAAGMNHGDAASALLSPLSINSNGSESSMNGESSLLSHHQNLKLDKKNLQLSLMSLLQDERFLDLIHAQYLKVAHARASKDEKSLAKQSKGEEDLGDGPKAE